MRKLALLGILGMALCLTPYSATAITIGFSPASQTVGPGDTLWVDVVISDLGGEIVSAYDLDVTYDASVLSATGISFGQMLGDESWWEVFNDADLSVAGLVDFAQLSLLSDAELAILQPDSFTLATLGFQATGPGTASLDFRFDAFNDITGLNAGVLDLDPASGIVQVIPEPHSALAFALGAFLVGTAIARKQPGSGWGLSTRSAAVPQKGIWGEGSAPPEVRCGEDELKSDEEIFAAS